MAQESTPLLSDNRSALEVTVATAIDQGGASSKADGAHGAVNRPISQVVPIWLKVAKRWFQGEEKWRARGYAAANALLALTTTGLLFQISYAQRNFQTAMSAKDEVGWKKSIWHFVGIILVAAPLFALADYVEEQLKIAWRQWLTQQLLVSYFSHRAFFNLKIQSGSLDNPDQRICDDVPAYTAASVTLVLGLMRKVFNLIVFSGVVWAVEPRLVLFLGGYAALGTWLTASVFGRRLMALYFRILQREGHLRFHLMRVRENAESVAFYNGEAREAAISSSRLGSLVQTTRQKIAWASGLSLWSNAYGYATILVPSLLVAPRYFKGELDFGVISQVSFAFGRIESSLSFIVDNLASLSGLAAQSERLDVLFTALLARPTPRSRIVRIPVAQPSITLEAVTLFTPEGSRVLAQRLSLVVQPGQSLLIVGPSGCGKSSLMRAVAGLWDEGAGMIHAPLQQDMFFLPQKPFMPLGSLREQLLFPSGEDRLISRPDVGVPSDKELLALLDQVRLPELAQRVGGLSAEMDWAHVLSLGEQQRIAVLRLLLHRPAMAFLDEATGALDTETEASLYQELSRHCQSLISIGHRMQLLKYHTHVLANEGPGVWTHYTAEEYQKALARKEHDLL